MAWAPPWGHTLFLLEFQQTDENELLYLQPEPVAYHGPADGTALEGGKLAGIHFHILNSQEVGGPGCMEKNKERY